VCEGERERRMRENVLARDCQESKHNAHVCACRISSLLQGSLAKETYNLKEPTNRSQPKARQCQESKHNEHLCVCVCVCEISYVCVA